MSQFSSIGTTLFLSMAALCVQAQDNWDYASVHKSTCADGGQLEMNLCLSREAGKVEKRMTQELHNLMGVLAHPASLSQSQVAWSTF
ncbi:hypothetical protein [Caenimonas aquaedulcis]|uniref:DUF1311 domain-containing protein n=1 Tax=Caenimonas aquaedulcis TaxID=2793270 RepID=A0A931H5U8_9BURK|nr:hypothetical protein [Caenimonas aquaedulcis]MBG9389189.1 hypothetical protein [Caenimonas aquaedulcis]